MPNISITLNSAGMLVQSEGKHDLQLTKETFSPGQLFVISVGG